MELFINALLVAAGVIVAVGLSYAAWHTLRFMGFFTMGWIKLKADQRQAEVRRANQAILAERRTARLNERAAAAMESAEVQNLVTELLATPYIDGRSNHAKLNNKQRAKLLGQLRKLVDCAATREYLYTGRYTA